MRTFNGLQIFTQQLTNSGQLDSRYVRISGNNSAPNLNFGVILGKENSIPASSNPVSTPIGSVGQIIFSSPHSYVCVQASNNLYTWKRLMIQDFGV